MAAEGARSSLTLGDLDAPTRGLVDDLVARCRFVAGPDPLVLGVSGGADSLAMLALAVFSGHEALAVHVDHGLRPRSAAEADVVERVASLLGASFEARSVTIEPGPNLEARAREARYEALGPGALVAHTRDDRAEWVLLALLRGSGIDGVSAMDPTTRPLLALRRTETVGLCRSLGFEFVEDQHNTDPRFRRVRVRAELIPLMNEIADRDVAVLLDRFAEVSRVDSELLDELAAAIDPTDARALTAAPVALARRAVRSWLRADHPLDLASTDRVLGVAAGRAVATEIVGGRRVRRSGQRLFVEESPGRSPLSGDGGAGSTAVV
ncbi:MAG: tRNA lysidine(34) synthetase TilS [Acidimicrobiales bacterium]|nr:tRNA lysidine(34) synthetase TilS [Acidimicrobiales bacterium]